MAFDRSVPRRPGSGRDRRCRRAGRLLFRRGRGRRVEERRRRRDLDAAVRQGADLLHRQPSPWRRPIPTSSTSAPAKPASAATSPTATASTSPPMAARPGRTWACATRATSARVIVDPRESRHRSSWRRWATPSARTPSAASSAPPTAARPGPRCCTRTTTPAPSTSPSIRNNPNILFAALWQVRAQPWTFDQRRPRQRPLSLHRRRRHLEATGRQRPARGHPGPHRRRGVRRRFRPRLRADRGRKGRPVPLRRRRRQLGAASTTTSATASAPGISSTSSPTPRTPTRSTCSTPACSAPPTAARRSTCCPRRTATTTACGSTRPIRERMIDGNDGGATISIDGGKTWTHAE